MRYRQNRWFTAEGKRKRVPAALESYRGFIIVATPDKTGYIDLITLTKVLRNTFNLSVQDAVNFAIFLHGLYDNKPPLFEVKRFRQGELVAKELRTNGRKAAV